MRSNENGNTNDVRAANSPRMNLKRTFRFLIAGLVCAGIGPTADGCTTFVLQKDGRLVFGRNLDWHVGEGLLIANPRRVKKRALVLPMSARETHPAQWVSQYGSVTFNSLGRDFPTGGMNEAGLVIEIMWLDATQYPPPDARPELHVLQWTQYLLDTCRTVEEVLATDAEVRISQDSTLPQHFLICDADGRVATIEFLEGKRVVHRADNLPHACLANSTYAESIRHSAMHQGADGSRTIPDGDGSIERFVRTAARIDAFARADQDVVDYAFDMLDGVNQGYELDAHSTVWSVVYDIGEKRILFRTHNHREIRRLELSQLKFDCAQPVPVWDVLSGGAGDITGRWTRFTAELNRETARKNVTHPAIVRTFGDLSALLAPVSGYAENFTACEE
jgi:penicillin V acylase-like amidase (Ntn superfamily)